MSQEEMITFSLYGSYIYGGIANILALIFRHLVYTSLNEEHTYIMDT